MATSVKKRGVPYSSESSLPEGMLSVAEAKTHLSSILNDVESLRRPVIISRRGIPIAQIVPIGDKPALRLSGSMAGSGRILGDIVSPLGIEWTAGDE